MKRGGGQSLRMDHGFLCPWGGLQRRRGTCYGGGCTCSNGYAPDAVEKKSGFSRLRLTRRGIYLGVPTLRRIDEIDDELEARRAALGRRS